MLLKMDSMQQTIQHLTKDEVRKFRHHLQVQNETKLLALFNLLLSSAESFTEKQLEEKIYGKVNGGRRASMLRHILKETMLDFLTSYRMLKRHKLLDKSFAAQIRIKKRIAEYTMLNRSGRNLPFAHQLLDEAIADAKKEECYSDLVFAMDQQKYHYGFSQGDKAFDKREKKTMQYERWRLAFRRAVYYYYKVIVNNKFSGNPDKKKLLKIIKEGLKEMKRDYADTRLPGVLYYQKKLESEYYQQKGNYKKAIQICRNTLKHLKKHPSVNNSQRTGYAHDDMAQCYIFLKNYKKAMNHLLLAQKNILKGTVNHLVSKEQEILLFFYDMQYDKVKQLTETSLRNFPVDAEPFLRGKLHFYLACALFKLNNYDAALKILKQKSEVFSDKAGWMFFSKLVEIMTLYEMKNFGEMKSALERFRKFIGYNKKAFTKRDLAVIRLLYLLGNSDNFLLSGKNKREAQKLVTLLKSNRNNYQWRPYSHEVIRFEEWVQEKIIFVNSKKEKYG